MKKLVLAITMMFLIVGFSFGADAALDLTNYDSGACFYRVHGAIAAATRTSGSNISDGAGTAADPYVIRYSYPGDASINSANYKGVSASYVASGSTYGIVPCSGATLVAYASPTFSGEPLTAFSPAYDRFSTLYCVVTSSGGVTQYFKVIVGAGNAAQSLAGEPLSFEQSYVAATNTEAAPKAGYVTLRGDSKTITAADIGAAFPSATVTLTSGSGGSQTIENGSVVTFNLLSGSSTCYYSIAVRAETVLSENLRELASPIISGEGTSASPYKFTVNYTSDARLTASAYKGVSSAYSTSSDYGFVPPEGGTLSAYSSSSFSGTTLSAITPAYSRYSTIYLKSELPGGATLYYEVTAGANNALYKIGGATVAFDQTGTSATQNAPRTGTVTINAVEATVTAADIVPLFEDQVLSAELLSGSSGTQTITSGSAISICITSLAGAAAYYSITADMIEPPSSEADIVKVVTNTNIQLSSAAGTIDDPILAYRANIADRVSTLAADIVPSEDATIEFFSDAGYSAALPGTTQYSLSSQNPIYTVYAKVVSEDLSNVKYYRIQIVSANSTRFLIETQSPLSTVESGQAFEINVNINDYNTSGSAYAGWYAEISYDDSAFVFYNASFADGVSATCNAKDGVVRIASAGAATANINISKIASLHFIANEAYADVPSSPFTVVSGGIYSEAGSAFTIALGTSPASIAVDADTSARAALSQYLTPYFREAASGYAEFFDLVFRNKISADDFSAYTVIEIGTLIVRAQALGTNSFDIENPDVTALSSNYLCNAFAEGQYVLTSSVLDIPESALGEMLLSRAYAKIQVAENQVITIYGNIDTIEIDA